MEEQERDTEVFERIPWEALHSGPDRRWMIYAGAAIVVVGAIGVSIGRSPAVPATTPAPPPASVTSVPTTSTPEVATTVVSASTPSTSVAEVITEADLMALDGANIDRQAMAAAEWFVVEWFTRESSDDDPSRSFVDWASTVSIEWLSSTRARVMVAIRRLATANGGSYQRVDDEAWSVDVEMTLDGWKVVAGPAIEDFPLTMDIESANAERTEWTDGAGLSWSIETNDVD